MSTGSIAQAQISRGPSHPSRTRRQLDGHRQDQAHPQEEQEIRKRAQPEEVPAHHIESLTWIDGPANDSRSHLQQPGGQTAPSR